MVVQIQVSHVTGRPEKSWLVFFVFTSQDLLHFRIFFLIFSGDYLVDLSGFQDIFQG